MEFIDLRIQDYAERMSSPEPAVLAALNATTHANIEMPRMLSGHLQGRVLAMLSKLLQPKRILEIGTYTGYSAICFAEGLAPDGLLTTIEYNADLRPMITDFFRQAGIADRARLIIGDATVEAPKVEGPLDLVFLDADKENYIRYFDIVLPKLRPGGVIIADNVLWSGQVLDPTINDPETKGLRDFARHVAACVEVEQVLLPIRDGILVIRKR
jgi:caffeoyl-CoA O-methyltransferase